MNTLDRIKRILRAVINDIIEQAEDPELELSRYVEATELALGEVRAEIEEAELRRRRLTAQLAEHRRCAKDWVSKAERAAGRDEDDLAKEALRQHHQAQAEAESCEERLAEVELTLRNLLQDAAELNKKLKEARLEQKRLSAQLRRAEAEKRAGSALTRAERSGSARDKLQNQIYNTQAESEAAREVHSESPEVLFGALDDQPSLDEELAALKQRLKSQKTGESD